MTTRHRATRRITANLDGDLLREAEQVLGTSGTTATLTAALAEVVRERRLRALLDHDLSDLSPEALDRLRRQRTG